MAKRKRKFKTKKFKMQEDGEGEEVGKGGVESVCEMGSVGSEGFLQEWGAHDFGSRFWKTVMGIGLHGFRNFENRVVERSVTAQVNP